MKTPFLLGMQAVMAMRFGEAALARQQAWLAVCYGPWQLRNLYTFILAMLPAGWRQALDTSARSLLRNIKGNAAS